MTDTHILIEHDRTIQYLRQQVEYLTREIEELKNPSLDDKEVHG